MARAVTCWTLVTLGVLGATDAPGQPPQSVDRDYDTKVAAPAYPEQHPSALFDEAHHNFHTTAGLYKPFADLIAHDGYRVAVNRKPFTRSVLDGHRILIIANAMGDEADGPRKADPAFTEAECQVVADWVEAGGSLLLITDQRHWGSAARGLGARFGVEMSRGLTTDPENSVAGMPARLIFDREGGLLGDHPILRGRGASEQVDRVVTYAGQSLLGPGRSVPLLRLGETAMDRSPDDAVATRAAGRCQGLALVHGKGRVVVLGEAAVLSAQFDQGGRPIGMNDPGTDNRQLALNIMHWLSGLIPSDAGKDRGPIPTGAAEPSDPPGIVVHHNLSYRDGPSRHWKLDLALKRDPGGRPRPGIVVIHGGGWIEGDKSSFASREHGVPGNIVDFAERGFVAATINYRLAGEAPFPSALEDCKNAVRWMRAHAKEYHLDPGRIGAYGNSAGGHLALLLAMTGEEASPEGDGPHRDQSSRVQAAVSDSGPVDLVDQFRSGALREVTTRFMGGPPEGDRLDAYRRASPIDRIGPRTPPLLLIYGVEDGQVPVETADRFVLALGRAGVRDVSYYRLARVDHCPHSLVRIPGLRPVVEEFFVRTLMPEGPGERAGDGRGTR